MKDDLHELIDGGLPDEQAAELLHLLSVDPEKRTMFRHQMQLQHGLCRNERHGAMTSFEEGEMLDRISRSVGEPAPSAGRFARRGILMLAVGFLVGSGAGYLGHSLDGGAVRARHRADRPAVSRSITGRGEHQPRLARHRDRRLAQGRAGQARDDHQALDQVVGAPDEKAAPGRQSVDRRELTTPG